MTSADYDACNGREFGGILPRILRGKIFGKPAVN